MSPRKELAARTACYLAGLGTLSLWGMLAAALVRLRLVPREWPARLASRLGRRLAEAAFPGIVSVEPFGDRYFTVRGIRYPGRVRGGEPFPVEIVLRNLSREAWDGPVGPYPVRLGTWDPEGPASVFRHPGWDPPDRAGALEVSVPPGTEGVFRMTFLAPAAPGRYRQELAPVADGLAWFAGAPLVVEIEVV